MLIKYLELTQIVWDVFTFPSVFISLIELQIGTEDFAGTRVFSLV